MKSLKTAPVTTDGEEDLSITAPTFDHAAKDPVENGISISFRTRLIIIEGNYTLLKQKPWDEIAEICDERRVTALRSRPRLELTLHRWFVDAPVEVVRDRLAQRHLAAGIESSKAAAIARAEENDIPNGELIRSLLIKPDVIIEN